MKPDDVAWEEIDGPDTYSPARVPESLKAIAAARSESEAREAYNDLLASIGNNHAGTVYPASVLAMPFIIESAHSDQTWERWAAREVVEDLRLSFRPEPGFESVTGPDGMVSGVAASIRRAIAEGGPDGED